MKGFNFRRSYWFLSITIFCLLCSCAPKSYLKEGEPKFSHEEDFNHWMQGYYKNPRPDLFIASIDTINTHENVDLVGGAPLFISFDSELFKQNSDLVISWMERVENWNLREGVYGILLGSLIAAQIEGGKEYVQTRLQESDGLKRKTLEWAKELDPQLYAAQESPEWPGDLDELWGKYFATGNNRYILPIIRTLELSPDPTTEGTHSQQSLLRAITGASALWSLLANSRQNPDVLAICKEAMHQSASPIVRSRLEFIIQEVEDPKHSF